MGSCLHDAVVSMNEEEVRHYLENCVNIDAELKGSCFLLHSMILENGKKVMKNAPGKKHIIYMLKNYGINVNSQDKDGNTPLHLALSCSGDLEICEALLQCGADLYLKNNEDACSIDYAAVPCVPEVTRELVQKYSPGLWRAVRDDDIMSVRKLINLWCRVDISHKNGRTLKELALEKGTEHIIRLITDIDPSMRLAHAVLASDVCRVKELCESSAILNTEFRNLGDMGATPLFYAIMQNNWEIVNALCNRGAKIDRTISFEDEDIPIYFAALNKETDPDIIKRLTPKRNENQYFTALHYRGRNVLLHCIENNVNVNAVRYILHQGYPELLAARDKRNKCAREIAESLDKHQYVKIIDEVVHEWYLDSDGEYRKILALMGYTHLRQAEKDGVKVSEVVSSMETSSLQAKFDTQLDQYQDHIQQLHEAVTQGNLFQVKDLMFYKSPSSEGFCCCLADSRAKSNGQPLLHKAVLRNHCRIVEYICQTFKDELDKKLDDSRDILHRTSLHYAYGMSDGREVADVLLDYGASEFTMDKEDRSPLVFTDYRDHPMMKKLLQYHLAMDFSYSEPDVWSCKRPKVVYCSSQGHSHGQGHSQGNPCGLSARLGSNQPPRPAAVSHVTSTSTAGYQFCAIL